MSRCKEKGCYKMMLSRIKRESRRTAFMNRLDLLAMDTAFKWNCDCAYRKKRGPQCLKTCSCSGANPS